MTDNAPLEGAEAALSHLRNEGAEREQRARAAWRARRAAPGAATTLLASDERIIEGLNRNYAWAEEEWGKAARGLSEGQAAFEREVEIEARRVQEAVKALERCGASMLSPAECAEFARRLCDVDRTAKHRVFAAFMGPFERSWTRMAEVGVELYRAQTPWLRLMADDDLREAEHARRASAVATAFVGHEFWIVLGGRMMLALVNVRASMCVEQTQPAAKERSLQPLREFGVPPPPECPPGGDRFRAGVGVDTKYVGFEVTGNCRSLEFSVEALEFFKVSLGRDRITHSTSIFIGATSGDVIPGSVKLESGIKVTIDAQDRLAELKLDTKVVKELTRSVGPVHVVIEVEADLGQ